MLLNIKNNQGFTIVELLIAVAIMGGISMMSAKLLYDTVSIRSKQYSIENSADSIRLILSTMSSAIQSAQSITFPNSASIKIIGNTEPGGTPCWLFQKNAGAIEQIKDYSDCSTGPTTMTQSNITINTFNITPTSPITITIAGIYKDSLGEHNINYTTSVTNRISI